MMIEQEPEIQGAGAPSLFERMQSKLDETQSVIEPQPQAKQLEGAVSGPPPASPMEQKLQETRMALRQQGVADPEDTNAVQNSLNAFWGKVADTVGLPADAINYGLYKAGLNIGEDGRGARNAVRSFMNTVGLRTDTYDGISKRFGEGIFDSAIILGSMFAAAPMMANRMGVSTTDHIVRQLGDFLQKNPGMATTMEAFGQLGSSTAGEATKGTPYEGLATMLGGTIGSGVPLMAETAARVGMRTVGALGRKMGAVATPDASIPIEQQTGPQRFGDLLQVRPTVPTTRDPFFQPDQANSGTPRYYAEEQVRGAQTQMDTAMNEAVDNISTAVTKRGAKLDPDTAQVLVRDRLDDAYTKAREIESDFWGKVPMTEKVPTAELVQNVHDFEQTLRQTQNSAFIPEDAIKSLYGLAATPQGAGGRFQPSAATVGRLRSEMKALSEAMYNEPHNTALNGNRKQLLGMINDAVENAIPDNVQLKQARAVSTKLNDLFTRGPVADVRAVDATRDTKVPPEQTVQWLLSKFQGIKSTLDIGDMARIPRAAMQPDAYPYATKSVEYRDVFNGVKDDMVQSIRSMVQEQAQFERDPIKVTKFVDRWERQIAPLGKEAAELRLTGDYIAAHADQKDMIQRSALARFAEADSDKAIATFWNSKDPQKSAAELVRAMQGNPDAMAGLQQLTIKKLLTSTNADFTRIRGILETPRYRDTLETILEPAQMTRLDKMVTTAESIARGDENVVRDLVRARFTIVGRLVGAMVGRHLETGTMQAPSIFANTFGRAVERMFSVTDADTLFTRAVMSPIWERALYQREPTSTLEFRTYNRNMRRMFGGIAGIDQYAQHGGGE